MDKPATCPSRQGHARSGAQKRAATTPGFHPASFTCQVAKKSLHHPKARAGTAPLPAHAVSQSHRATNTQGLPREMGSPYLPAHLQHSNHVRKPPFQLPHHSLLTHTLTCDSLQTSLYHLPQGSSRFTSHLKAPTRTISEVILPFVSQQRAALMKSKSQGAWASVRTSHTSPTLL